MMLTITYQLWLLLDTEHGCKWEMEGFYDFHNLAVKDVQTMCAGPNNIKSYRVIAVMESHE